MPKISCIENSVLVTFLNIFLYSKNILHYTFNTIYSIDSPNLTKGIYYIFLCNFKMNRLARVCKNLQAKK